jgi:hypothetical protein
LACDLTEFRSDLGVGEDAHPDRFDHPGLLVIEGLECSRQCDRLSLGDGTLRLSLVGSVEGIEDIARVA